MINHVVYSTWYELLLRATFVMRKEGFFDHLLAFFDHTVQERFVRQENRDMLLVEKEPEVRVFYDGLGHGIVLWL